jgi:hypothetical protein
VTVGHIEYAASMTIDRTGLPKYDVEIKTDFDVTAPNGLKSTVAYGVDTSISVDDHLPQHSVPVERRRAVQLDPKIVLAIAAGTVPISVLAKILGRARTATQTPAPVFG